MDRGMRVFTIAGQSDETPTIKTVRMEGALDARPGQFIMVWVPGVDEMPMSISQMGEHFGITYKIIGDGTRRLAGMASGEKLGIRGPYGRGYTLDGGRILAVAGGTGMACLAPLVEQALASGSKVEVVLGARTERELLMEARCQKAGATVHVTTDDGSKGAKGFATDKAAMLMETGGFDQVFACGPEQMIVGVLRSSMKSGVPMQASLERYMKCGIGICDSCALDGKHVCTDGPVFSGEELTLLAELGRSKLAPSGSRIPI